MALTSPQPIDDAAADALDQTMTNQRQPEIATTTRTPANPRTATEVFREAGGGQSPTGNPIPPPEPIPTHTLGGGSGAGHAQSRRGLLEYAYNPLKIQAPGAATSIGAPVASPKQDVATGVSAPTAAPGQVSAKIAPKGPETTYKAATGQAVGYDPATYSASRYSAYHKAVQDNDLARHQLEKMLDSDSDYIKQARTAGEQYANSRGLLNTAMAAAASQGSAIKAAAPIAMQDANTFNQRSLAEIQNENAARHANAQFEQQANQFNAGATNQARQFNAGAINTATWNNLNAINQANKFNAGAMNDTRLQEARINADVDIANARLQQSAAEADAARNQQMTLANMQAKNQASSQQSQQDFQGQIEKMRAENQAAQEKARQEFQAQIQNARNQAEADRLRLSLQQRQDEMQQQHTNKEQLLKMEQNQRLKELDYTTSANMKSSYINDMKEISETATKKIHEIQGRTDIDGAAKTKLIEQVLAMRDADRTVLGDAYQQMPHWDATMSQIKTSGENTDTKTTASPQAQPADTTSPSSTQSANTASASELTTKIQDLYKNILKREADEAGLGYYLKQIQDGKLELEDLEEILKASEEYSKLAENNDDYN